MHTELRLVILQSDKAIKDHEGEREHGQQTSLGQTLANIPTRQAEQDHM